MRINARVARLERDRRKRLLDCPICRGVGKLVIVDECEDDNDAAVSLEAATAAITDSGGGCPSCGRVGKILVLRDVEARSIKR